MIGHAAFRLQLKAFLYVTRLHTAEWLKVLQSYGPAPTRGRQDPAPFDLLFELRDGGAVYIVPKPQAVVL